MSRPRSKTERNQRLYRIWNGMKYRCGNPKSQGSQWYYYKGIRVCDEWSGSFETFQSWALSNGYAEDLTIDRIDPDGNYCPENCRWVTRSDNAKFANQMLSEKGVCEVWRVCFQLHLIEVVETGLSFRKARNLAHEYNNAAESLPWPYPPWHYQAAKPKEPHNVGTYLHGFPGEFKQ